MKSFCINKPNISGFDLHFILICKILSGCSRFFVFFFKREGLLLKHNLKFLQMNVKLRDTVGSLVKDTSHFVDAPFSHTHCSAAGNALLRRGGGVWTF